MKKFFFALTVVILTTGFIHAQGKIALGVNAGVALPMGDFGDGYDMGFGGNGLFVYHATPNVDVTGSVGYLTWSGKDALDGATFSSVPVLVGGRYLFGKGNFNPYVAAQLGMHFTTYDVEVMGFSTSGSDSYFGWNIGAGFLMGVGKNMDLDVNVLYNTISSEGSSSSYLGILVGLLFGLN